MKRLLLVLPLLISAAFVTGCSNDIKVESDLGEVRIIKESAITTYLFDKDLAIRLTEATLGAVKETIMICEQLLDKASCQRHVDDVSKADVSKAASDQLVIREMPDVTIVKYRTIDINLNGDKTASGYKYVSCLPDGELEERHKWGVLIASYDGVNTNPKKEIDNNLINDGTVASQVRAKICEKYGNV